MTHQMFADVFSCSKCVEWPQHGRQPLVPVALQVEHVEVGGVAVIVVGHLHSQPDQSNQLRVPMDTRQQAETALESTEQNGRELARLRVQQLLGFGRQ